MRGGHKIKQKELTLAGMQAYNLQCDVVGVPGAQEIEITFCRLEREHGDSWLAIIRSMFVHLSTVERIDRT